MMATNVNAVVADLTAVKDHFATNTNRLTREKVSAQLAEVRLSTPEAREIVASSIRKMFAGVIWEDDIRGADISQQMEIEILRFQKNA